MMEPTHYDVDKFGGYDNTLTEWVARLNFETAMRMMAFARKGDQSWD